MSVFFYEWWQKFRWNFPVCAWAIITFVLGLSGPFGTYIIPPLERFSLWAAFVACAAVIGFLARYITYNFLKIHSFWRLLVVKISLMTFTITPLIYVLLSQLLDKRVDPPSYVELSIFVFVTSLVACILVRKVGMYQQAAADKPAPPDDSPPMIPDSDYVKPRIFERLPQNIALGRLLFLSVRDHYVYIETDCGSFPVLMRLSDALLEVENIPGGRIHRSYWVAWDAVRALDSQGRRANVILHDGRRLPVSLTHRPALDAQGFEITKS